jgi:YteA family regulatory protein
VQLSSLRQRLLEERAEYEEQIKMIDETHGRFPGHDGSLQIIDESVISNHPGDLGSETFEREKDLGLRSGFERHISEIEGALARMQEGSYGVCEVCGKPIPRARLEAMPSATACIACQERIESLNDPFHRPIEEQVLNPPFGRTFRSGTDDPGYDGEDAWQEVAQHGTSESPSDVPGAVSYRDLYNSDENVYGVADPLDAIAGEDGEVLPGVAVTPETHVFSITDPLAQEGGIPLPDLAREAWPDGDGYAARRSLAEDIFRTDHLKRRR